MPVEIFTKLKYFLFHIILSASRFSLQFPSFLLSSRFEIEIGDSQMFRYAAGHVIIGLGLHGDMRQDSLSSSLGFQN